MQTTQDGKVKLGGDLSLSELAKLQKSSPSGSDILNNLDDLNSEIVETANARGVKLPETYVPQPNGLGKIKKERQMSLDEELDQLNKKLDAERKKATVEKVERKEEESEEEEEVVVPQGTGDSIKDQVIGLLKQSGGVTDHQIAQWKAQHGRNGVYAIGMGEGDVYVFTHLKRGQWKKIQEIMSKMQASDDSFDAEDEMKKKVVQYCVLWPQPLPLEFFYNSRAGVLDAIYQSILLNSYFLSPQQTMMLTTQL